MVAGSNDWFLAPAAGGIELFDADGNLNAGPVVLVVWDAGTEKDLNAAGDDLNTAELAAAATTGSWPRLRRAVRCRRQRCGTEKDLNAAGDDLNTAEFGRGDDVDNDNDAADDNTMIRPADTMMKAVTATATLSMVE